MKEGCRGLGEGRRREEYRYEGKATLGKIKTEFSVLEERDKSLSLRSTRDLSRIK